MRMWGVDPKFLCRNHLLGEHVEMHMFAGTIRKGISIQGYIDKKLVNPRLIKVRHDILVEEMKSRGYNHNSDLNLDDIDDQLFCPLDLENNEKDLKARCSLCFSKNNK